MGKATRKSATASAGPVNAARLAAAERRGRVAVAPALLTALQAAALLGVSERKFSEMRAAGLVPDAIALGERALRWRRDELLEHVAATAPRVRMQAEPAPLARKKAALAKGA